MRHLKLAALAAALLGSTAAFAHDFTVGDLRIDHPWSRATSASQANGVAYAVIENRGEAADRLVSASAEVASKVEIHNNILDDKGVVRMRQVEGGIEIPAGGKLELKPASYHIMMMGLQAPLAEGQRFPLVLTFEKAGETTVEVQVDAAVKGAAGGHGSH
ncbi:copper chaperone PCu(A)C [Marinimicrococcus flavescens]|uniref:Copper chaperone PCu(A)C n=1 Tax=Marinimicrococcus flavescens TaxID=3031815 RepID=A0AAP3UXU1_9PROT|nr:copper chaperone PCu(A)C [Marinimicrococcus flavescens]